MMDASLRRCITTRYKLIPCLQCRLFSSYSRNSGRYSSPQQGRKTTQYHNTNEGEEIMESEHDNYSNKNFQNKQKPKFGNIRNFKPVENTEYNHKSNYTHPKSTTNNSKSQYIYGRACVYGALTANRRKAYNLFVSENTKQQTEDEEESERSPEGFKSFSIQECIAKAQEKQIPVVRYARSYLNSLSGDRPHQGVVLEASEIHYEPITNLERPSESNKSKKFPLWIALDQIWDPQNFGSIVRSCYFFGVDGLVIAEHNSPLSPTASRASAGALEVFPIFYQRYLNKFIGESQKQGWHVIGASVTSQNNVPTISARDIKLDKPTILVLGNESFGLRDKISSMCNAIVNIRGQPETKVVDSLNVGVATGVLLHSLFNNK